MLLYEKNHNHYRVNLNNSGTTILNWFKTFKKATQ